MLAPDPQLSAAVLGGRKAELVVIVRESGSHGSVEERFELTIILVESVQHRDQILALRLHTLVDARHCRLAKISVLVDPHIVMNRPSSNPPLKRISVLFSRNF